MWGLDGRPATDWASRPEAQLQPAAPRGEYLAGTPEYDPPCVLPEPGGEIYELPPPGAIGLADPEGIVTGTGGRLEARSLFDVVKGAAVDEGRLQSRLLKLSKAAAAAKAR